MRTAMTVLLLLLFFVLLVWGVIKLIMGAVLVGLAMIVGGIVAFVVRHYFFPPEKYVPDPTFHCC